MRKRETNSPANSHVIHFLHYPVSAPLLYWTHHPLAFMSTRKAPVFSKSACPQSVQMSYKGSSMRISSHFEYHMTGIMRMGRPSTLIIIAIMLVAGLTTSGVSAWGNKGKYVRDACSVTRYRDLCIRSLASFSNTAKTSPSKWARAGVSVTIGQVKSVNQYLIKLKKYSRMRGKNRVALSDCIECFQDTIDQLHKSLAILRKLSARNFDTQMSDLTTFLSTALTDESTCLDGFEGQKGGQVHSLNNRVLNATYFTSNALALVNKLATTGLESLTDP